MPTFHKQSAIKERINLDLRPLIQLAKFFLLRWLLSEAQMQRLVSDSLLRRIAALQPETWNTRPVPTLDQWQRFAVLHRRVLPSLSRCFFFFLPPCTAGAESFLHFGSGEAQLNSYFRHEERERERTQVCSERFFSFHFNFKDRFKEPHFPFALQCYNIWEAT